MNITIPSENATDTVLNESTTFSFPRKLQITSGISTIDRSSREFFSVNRNKTVPFLIRVFPNVGPHRREDDYLGKELPKNELRIHSWMDATLRELAELIKQAIPETRGNRRISFRRVCRTRPRPIMRQMGVVHSSARGLEERCMIKDKMFEIGDFIDISIY